MWATNLKIVGVVLGTLALYTLIANKIPQVQSEVPRALTLGADVTPEQLVQAGEQVFNGIGGCTTCHGLGTRAPNLLTDEKGAGPIGARCGKRSGGSGGAGGFAPGSTDPMTLFRAAGCVGCHKIGAEGGAIGPDLTHIGARASATYIRESILDPGAKIAKGFERFAGIMPKTFGDQMTAAQLEALVRFLAARK